MRNGAAGGFDGPRMDVQQIGDHFGVIGMRERSAHHARLAVVESGHGVEQVRETRRARVECFHAFLVGAGAVP